ncbi:hypothetical protein D9M71_808880 [compost metagenome]
MLHRVGLTGKQQLLLVELHRHTLGSQPLNQRQQIRQRARQAVDRVDMQGIAAPDSSQHGLQLKPVHCAAADFVSEYLVQVHTIQLPDCVLVRRADPNVTNVHRITCIH